MIYTTKTPASQALVTLVLADGQYAGRVSQVGPTSFRASRKRGAADDIRMLSMFRSFDAALAWVCKQSTEAEANAAAALICAGPGPAKA